MEKTRVRNPPSTNWSTGIWFWAAVEFIGPGKGLVSAISEKEMIQSGKHPGKINFTDADNALNILKYLMDRPAAAIMKHNNPSGVAYGATLVEAYDRANLADRIAAFGGCLIVNRAMDKATAEMVSENYLEVVGAPEYEAGVVDILMRRKNLRIVRIPRMDRLAEYRNTRFVDFKSLIDGGIIVQQSSLNAIKTKKDFKKATAAYKGKTYTIEREPTEEEYSDMIFGWAVEQGVSSNSVLYVKKGVTVGIGTGEQDRVGVAEIAVFKAYTKYADTLCFQKYGVPYKTLEMEIAQGKRDPGDKGGDRPADQGNPWGHPGSGDDLRCLLPLPGWSGRGNQRGSYGHRPSGRIRPGLRIDPGLQRGQASGDHGLHRPESL